MADDDSDSDPAEADILEHTHRAPGLNIHTRTYRLPQPGPQRFGERPPIDPQNPEAMFQRFFEALGEMEPTTNRRDGGPPGDGFGVTRRTVQLGGPLRGGTASFTITTSRGNMPRGGGLGSDPPGGFDVYARSNPLSPFDAAGQRRERLEQLQSGRAPRITILAIRTGTDQRTASSSRILQRLMGGLAPPGPNNVGGNAVGGNNNATPAADPVAGGPRDFEAMIQRLMQSIMNPANAVHGDAVYTQEALDHIVTALMEAHPQSGNAAPPASDNAITSLAKKKVDDAYLGPEGKAECTICIEELHLGDELVELPCKHSFHEPCVTMWLKQHNTCPICRNPVEAASSRRPGEVPAPSPAGSAAAGGAAASSSSSAPQPPADRPTWQRITTQDNPGVWDGGVPTRTSRYRAQAEERLARIRAAAGAGFDSEEARRGGVASYSSLGGLTGLAGGGSGTTAGAGHSSPTPYTYTSPFGTASGGAGGGLGGLASTNSTRRDSRSPPASPYTSRAADDNAAGGNNNNAALSGITRDYLWLSSTIGAPNQQGSGAAAGQAGSSASSSYRRPVRERGNLPQRAANDNSVSSGSRRGSFASSDRGRDLDLDPYGADGRSSSSNNDSAGGGSTGGGGGGGGGGAVSRSSWLRNPFSRDRRRS